MGGESDWDGLKALLEIESVEAVGHDLERDKEWLWARLKSGEVLRRSVDDLVVALSMDTQEAREHVVESLKLGLLDRERAERFRERGKRLGLSVRDNPLDLEPSKEELTMEPSKEAEGLRQGGAEKDDFLEVELPPATEHSGPTDAELRKRFSYHPPGSGRWREDEDAWFYEEFRAKCLALARYVSQHTPTSREQSRALTALDDVCFNGNAARARRG